MSAACILGCAGLRLGPEERALFREVRPWGFILFARNIEDADQTRALIDALREAADDAGAPVFVDQEGGRVQRLKPPLARRRRPADLFGALYVDRPETAVEAVWLNHRLIAHELAALGFDADCAPCVDLRVPGAHDIIGDRAFAADPATIIDLGRVQIQGLTEGGVLPVMKHVPGHGRAGADSHLALPRVAATVEELSASDFVTFRSLDSCPMAMTAHVVYEAIDPQRPATTSPKVIRDVIRGEIGFDGLLISDDLSMQALDGPLELRAKAALFAGCDVVLHCNGNMDEMKLVATEAKALDGISLKRAEQALSHLVVPEAFDPAAAAARLTLLLGAGT